MRAERFGPRTLDVDVLWIEGYRSEDPQLTVPHPRMYERAFVLAPLHDLAPQLVPDELLGGASAPINAACAASGRCCAAAPT